MIHFQSRPGTPVGILLAAVALPLITGVSAGAATLGVTTTADVIAVDGQCSLREAVTAANTNQPFSDCPAGEALPIVDLIELPAGTYTLTLLPIDEDANLGGDLDITEAVTVRGLGNDFIWWDDPATPDIEPLEVWGDPTGFPRTFTEADLPDVIIEMGIGKPETPGDGDRIFEIVAPPSDLVSRGGAETSLYAFENLGIVRGDAFCEVIPPTSICLAGAGGIEFGSPDALELRRVALFENRAGCSGSVCGNEFNGAALRVSSSTDLSVTESVIASNLASCADSECRTGYIVHQSIGSADPVRSEMDRSLVVDNVTACSTRDCTAGGIVRLQSLTQEILQTVFTGNETGCSAVGFDCGVDPLLELGFFALLPVCVDGACQRLVQDVEISENRMTCDGFECNVSEVFLSPEVFDQSLERLRFLGNVQQCTGFNCGLFELLDARALGGLPGSSLDIRTLDIADNVNHCIGTECDVDNILQVVGEELATLTDIAVRGEGQCTGNRCGVRNSVLLSRIASAQDLSVTDTAVSCVGEDCFVRSLLRVVATSAVAPTLGGLVLTGNDVSCSSPGCGFGDEANPGHVGEGGILALTTPGGPLPSASIDQATITGNTTSARGILASNLDLEIADSTISMNASALDGGAIFNGWIPDAEMPEVISPGTLTLRAVTIEGNEAGQGASAGNGGGLFNPAGATLRLMGGAIENNTASDGGGIWNEGSIVLRRGTSLASNTPNDCVDALGGSGCDLLHSDDFESGDTSFWSETVQ